MATALFLGLPLHGHTNPTLPLVRALVERGEQVCYFSSEPFAEKIRQAGASYRAYRNAFLANPRALADHTDQIPWLLTRTTAEILVDHLDEFRAVGADYVVSDSLAPWGLWIAELLGVPMVTSVTTFAFNRRVMAFAASRGARPKSARRAFSKIRHVVKAARLARGLRRRYGVTGAGVAGLMLGGPGLNLVYTSREFQPCAESFDERYLFIGPSLGARTEAAAANWDADPGSTLVYVSLGTLFNTDTAFYRLCFEAFADLDVRVVMAVGTLAAERLGPPPANVVALPWVPQLDVLKRASVFVTHGGMNSVSESLSDRVPMVVVPQMSEQEIVAGQVEALGAGLTLTNENVSADRLRRAVARVLDDHAFQEGAARLGRSFETAGGAARGAEAIIAFWRHRDGKASTQ